MIDHEVRTPDDELDELVKIMEKTEKLWNKNFPEEPYKLSESGRSAKDVEDFCSSFLYDISSASTRQQMFFYQVRAYLKIMLVLTKHQGVTATLP